jgi:glycosyltransferase involved in cell wall biosynthesis
MRPNAAIYYVIDSYNLGGTKLMGMQSANAGFLNAYFRYSGVDRFYCYASKEPQFREFRDSLAQAAPGLKTPVEWIPQPKLEALAKPGCLFVPSPTIAGDAWSRRRLDERSYSLCGLTHTTCSDAAMDAFGALMIAPMHPWDALVCTSSAVKTTIDRVLGNWCDYLGARLNGKPSRPFELPVIPLGVDCESFDRHASEPGLRQRLRSRLGIPDDEIVVLYVGRLSFHAKAHPLPMYLALEQAARRTGRRLHLIQSGWFANNAIENHFVTGAKNYCPSVNVKFVDGRQPDIRQSIWFAADIFTSLSDNIQETFGLVPIEAMAAGLPQVISDWDGYKDTVRHGVDGFRIATAMPPGGTGQDIAQRFLAGIDTYDRYIAHSSQCIAVDIPSCADAYVRLIENPALRREMGEAGRHRAHERFDWRVVVAGHQELWAELAQRRAAANAPARPPGGPWHPLREDPFAVFECYATEILGPEAMLALAENADLARLERMYADSFVNYAGAPFVLASRDETKAMLSHAAKGPSPVAEFLKLFAPERRIVVHRSLGWLAKAGLLRVMHQRAVPGEQPTDS